MLVHLEARLAYFAMTKSASTSVENALKRHCQIVFSGDHRVTHMMPQRFETHLRPYLERIGLTGVETCCQMRRPVDWVESWWRYRSQPGRWEAGLDTSEVPFEDFVAAYLDGADIPYARIGRQRNFLTAPDGRVLVDYIYRVEEMDLFRRFLEARTGLVLDIGHHNPSPRRWARLSPQMRARLDAYLDVENTLWENHVQRSATPEGRTPPLPLPPQDQSGRG